MLFEVFRDNANVVHAMVNGVELTIGGGVTMTGSFNMTGLSNKSVSGFDDAGFEYVVCKGLPTVAQRSKAREYLRSKWNLYLGTDKDIGEVVDEAAVTEHETAGVCRIHP